jgi:hypothetical protein
MNKAEYDDKGVPTSTGRLWGFSTVEGQRVEGITSSAQALGNWKQPQA